MQCIAFSTYPRQAAPMLTKRVGENIRAARKRYPTADKKGLSLEKLAAKMGENWQTLQKLEKAETAISIEWIEKIAAALEVDPIELVAPEAVRSAAPSKGPEAIHLDEQVEAEAAKSLAAAALGEAEPDWGSVQAVSEVLRELLLTFSKFPEAQTDVRVARPVIAAVGRRFGPAAH